MTLIYTFQRIFSLIVDLYDYIDMSIVIKWLTPKVLWEVLEVNFNVRSGDCEWNFCWFVVPFLWRM
jgi:hypothetical protein